MEVWENFEAICIRILMSSKTGSILYHIYKSGMEPLADPGGGAPGAPPNGRGPMIVYAQNAKFSKKNFVRFARDSI